MKASPSRLREPLLRPPKPPEPFTNWPLAFRSMTLLFWISLSTELACSESIMRITYFISGTSYHADTAILVQTVSPTNRHSFPRLAVQLTDRRDDLLMVMAGTTVRQDGNIQAGGGRAKAG